MSAMVRTFLLGGLPRHGPRVEMLQQELVHLFIYQKSLRDFLRNCDLTRRRVAAWHILE